MRGVNDFFLHVNGINAEFVDAPVTHILAESARATCAISTRRLIGVARLKLEIFGSAGKAHPLPIV
jgi:hypothetical protein